MLGEYGMCCFAVLAFGIMVMATIAAGAAMYIRRKKHYDVCAVNHTYKPLFIPADGKVYPQLIHIQVDHKDDVNKIYS